MTKRSLLRTLLALSLLLLGSGCTFINHSTFSAPRVDPNFSYDGINGVLFQLQDLDISVSIQNRSLVREIFAPFPLPPFIFVNSKPTYEPVMWVEIHFDIPPPSKNASEIIKTTVEFHPMEVQIQSAGVTMSPKGFVGPSGGQTFALDLSPTFRQKYSCKPADEELRADSEPILMGGKNCFWFAFDRSAAPDDPFVVHLNGLARDGVSIAIPAIRFEKGGEWRSGSAP